MNVNDILRNAGIDYDAAMERFHNSETLFYKYLFRLPEESLVNEAKEAFEKNDFEKASFPIHTLKSIIGNLSINYLFSLTVEMMEKLRNNEGEKAKELFFSEFFPEYKHISEVIKMVRN